jgi:hypothetical protein
MVPPRSSITMLTALKATECVRRFSTFVEVSSHRRRASAVASFRCTNELWKLLSLARLLGFFAKGNMGECMVCGKVVRGILRYCLFNNSAFSVNLSIVFLHLLPRQSAANLKLV